MKIKWYCKHIVIVALLAFAGVLLASCSKDNKPELAEEQVVDDGNNNNNNDTIQYVTRPYSLTAKKGIGTHLSLIGESSYVFKTGDKLYLSNQAFSYNEVDIPAGAIWGTLLLDPDDNNETIGHFTGALNINPSVFPDVDIPGGLPLNIWLVGIHDKIHTIEGGRVTGIVYPSEYNDSDPQNPISAYGSSLSDAVEKFSDIKTDPDPAHAPTFANPSITLLQYSTFLVFDIDCQDGTSAGESMNVVVKNGGDVLRSSPITTVNSSGVKAQFVAAFPGGTEISDATFSLQKSGIKMPRRKFRISNCTLASNTKYTVSRTLPDMSDYFTVQVEEDGTSVTFNYAEAGNYYQYKTFEDGEWTDYLTASSDPVELDAGECVYWRGKRTRIRNSLGIILITTSNSVSNPSLVYGDVMSLMCSGASGVYTKRTTMPSTECLKAVFNNITNIDIHPVYDFVLSAPNLTSSCYAQMFLNSSITRGPRIEAINYASNSCNSMFSGCTNLVSIPDFSVPTITGGSVCYQMFNGCTSLLDASNITLSATTVYNECYRQMFAGCTGLVTPPSAISATSTSGLLRCYYQMFNGCTSLTSTPSISATELGDYCCYQMFNGCTSLTSAAALPATGVGTESYKQMFQGCTSLVNPPASIGATTIGNNGCRQMFQNCTSLVTTPTMPSATNLGDGCCYQMFQGCTSLASASALPATTIGTGCYSQMFQNCTGLVTPPSSIGATTIPENGCYRMFQGCSSLTTTPAMTSTTAVGNHSCFQMFQNCTGLTTASALPATTLASHCYYQMFQGCSSLVTPPASIGATAYVQSSCFQMFRNCISLTSTPTFTVNSVANNSLNGMFNGCLLLTNISGVTLSATTLARACYKQMFYNCTSLESTPDLSAATTVAPSCFYEMFSGSGITSVTTVLSATNLSGADSCYANLFNNCASLVSVPSNLVSAATTLERYCFKNLLSSTAIVTAPDLPAENIAAYCYMNMFKQCYQLETAPSILPAMTLAQNCYQSMFFSCPKLEVAPVLPATDLVTDCYREMFKTDKSVPSKLRYVKCMATTGLENVGGVGSNSNNFLTNAGSAYKDGDHVFVFNSDISASSWTSYIPASIATKPVSAWVVTSVDPGP